MNNKLHLGCGKRHLNGYFHVDIIDYEHVDFVCDIACLDFLKNESCDEIYASHTLEHFKAIDIKKALLEWCRVLKPGGIIRLSVPDFDSILKYVSDNGPASLEHMQGLLYGGQSHDYNFHHVCFNFHTLGKLLIECGFKNISRYDWRDFLPEGFDDYSRAYMPHMDFENGSLMSLNILAEKS